MSSQPHQPHRLYTSTFSIPYSKHSALNTLDIHLPTTPPLKPAYWIVYIHGGAFRDPLITSRSILPSLPGLFNPWTLNQNTQNHDQTTPINPSPQSHNQNTTGPTNPPPQHHNQTNPPHHIAGLASLNYNLTPYPSHPIHPSHDNDKARNAKWPDMLEDVWDGIGYLLGIDGKSDELDGLHGSIALEGHEFGPSVGNNALGASKERHSTGNGKNEMDGSATTSKGIMAKQPWVLIGHSVGGTMGLFLGLSPTSTSSTPIPPSSTPFNPSNSSTSIAPPSPLPGLKAIISLSGIFNFTSLRDAHLSYRDIYNEFITAAFGPEEEGGWEGGNVVAAIRGGSGDGGRGEGEDGRVLAEGIEILMVAQSKDDELVELGQGRALVGALRAVEGEGDQDSRRKVEIIEVEVKGAHDEILEQGRVVGEVVGRVVGLLVDLEGKEGEVR